MALAHIGRGGHFTASFGRRRKAVSPSGYPILLATLKGRKAIAAYTVIEMWLAREKGYMKLGRI